jgi:uroporphyrinogen-III synthase
MDAIALPLIEIQFVDPGGVVDGSDPPTALMFVSPNAVRGFFKEKKIFSDNHSASVAIKNISDAVGGARAWATGPGTRQALLDAHWPPDRIDAPPPDAVQWDAKVLWPVVQDQVQDGTHILMVQGQSDLGGPGPAPTPELAGSTWLTQALRRQGARVSSRVVYRRQAPAFTAAQRDLALAAQGPDAVWLMSSSEAIDHLRRWLPDASWARAWAVATHPRIAQAALGAGFGQVVVCRPLVAEVVASIESFA